jgi:hypothetical protein
VDSLGVSAREDRSIPSYSVKDVMRIALLVVLYQCIDLLVWIGRLVELNRRRKKTRISPGCE